MEANNSTRRQPRLLYGLGGALLACAFLARWFERTNPIEMRHYVAFRSPAEARQRALATKKLVLFTFLTQRDLESSRMERELFADAATARAIDRDYVVVRLEDRAAGESQHDPTVIGLATQFRAPFPSLVASDPDGRTSLILPRHLTTRRALGFLNSAAQQIRSKQSAAIEPEADSSFSAALSRIGSASLPTFSPDGKRVAFISDLSGQNELWVVDAAGGYPELVASMEDGITGAQWSPDGAWIAFVSPPPGTKGPQVYVVRPDGTDLRRLTGGGGERNIASFWTRQSQLPISVLRRTTNAMECALFDPATGRSRVVATVPQFGIILDVSCDGRRALLLRRDGNVRGTYVVDVDRGTMRPLLPPADGEQITGAIDCDGASMVGVSNHGRDRNALVRVSLAGTSFGSVETLWERGDAELSGAVFSSDLQRAATVWNRDGADELWLVEPSNGRKRRVDLDGSQIGSLTFSRDGRLLAVSASGARSPSDIFIVDVESLRVRQLTRSAHPGLDLRSIAPPELIGFRGDDGTPLSGWLYRAASPGAAVISVHGGPNLQEGPALSALYQSLVREGVSVFAPNIRGSSGFGKRFSALDDGARRVDAIADIRSAAAVLVEKGIAAPGRLGIMGESYGGYMTVAAITAYPELFAAAVDEFGMVDLRRMISDAPPDVAEMLRAEFGSDPQLLEKLSPIANIARARTPLLVLHGAHDSQVALWHSNEVVSKLRERGVKVDYIVFPDEGHIFRKDANRARETSAICSWFARLLVRRAGKSPSQIGSR